MIKKSIVNDNFIIFGIGNKFRVSDRYHCDSYKEILRINTWIDDMECRNLLGNKQHNHDNKKLQSLITMKKKYHSLHIEKP